MIYVPEFYHAFSCRANACRHSCCRGWEIDVDARTETLYASVPGAFGARLRASICHDSDGAHFLLTEGERCPFLQQDGLCEIICRLGENALCDICSLHPRFFASVGENELWGLGLSCEAVCALLLKENAPLKFVCEETGERLLFSELLNRLGIPAQSEALNFDGKHCSGEYLSRMEKTEPIDDAWSSEFELVRAGMKPDLQLPIGNRSDRILQYLLFRQLERLEDTQLCALLDFARDSTSLILAQDVLFGNDPEHLRRWSEQIEYSTENVDILLGNSDLPAKD